MNNQKWNYCLRFEDGKQKTTSEWWNFIGNNSALFYWSRSECSTKSEFILFCSYIIHIEIKILNYFFLNFQLSIEQIRQHFSLFGGIKSLTVSFFDESRYVFIVFENSRSAQASVAIPTHRINQRLVNVHLNKSYSTFIDIDLSLVPQHQESRSHLINSMPDECLLGIFKFLEMKDLSNVADTCTTFRRIAKDIFKNEFSLMHYYETTIDQMDKRTLARFVRNFGACMESFVLDCNKMLYGSTRRYLELFCRHCAVPESSLKTLKIKNFSRAHKMEFSDRIDFIISNLETLKLEKCDGLKFSFGRKSNGSRQ